MDTVVTEELRGRSGPGRTLVEGEEDVDLVRDVLTAQTLADDAIRVVATSIVRDAVQAALYAQTPVHPSMHPSALRAIARKALNQPDPLEFLARDYYSHRANRFLFSCSTDPDGCAMNQGSAWHYAIPPCGTGGASSSGSSSNGSVFGQTGGLFVPERDS